MQELFFLETNADIAEYNNNCDTLHDNCPQGIAETLSQTGVKWSYVLHGIMYPLRDILQYFKKGTFLIVKVDYCRMSLDPKPLD